MEGMQRMGREWKARWDGGGDEARIVEIQASIRNDKMRRLGGIVARYCTRGRRHDVWFSLCVISATICGTLLHRSFDVLVPLTRVVRGHLRPLRRSRHFTKVSALQSYIVRLQPHCVLPMPPKCPPNWYGSWHGRLRIDYSGPYKKGCVV